MNPIPGGGLWGRGFRGGGRGWRNWYYATGMPGWVRAARGLPAWGGAGYVPPAAAWAAPAPEQEAQVLRQQADLLQQQLEGIKARLDELESEAD